MGVERERERERGEREAVGSYKQRMTGRKRNKVEMQRQIKADKIY